MASTLTIADLASDPGLDTRIVSGDRGSERAVMWAHSCEMSDPTRWLGPHELLMTVGLCIPTGSQKQRAFIASLDDAGLAGIAIGDDDMAPHLTKALFAESEARNFPVLITGQDTPFAILGRTVAAANADRQTMDVLMLAKLYQVAGRRDADALRTGAQLSDLFGTTLTVVDDATGCVVIGPGVVASPGLRAHKLRTQRPTHLLLSPDARLNGFALVHLSQVLAVDAAGLLQDANDIARRGAEAFQAALAGSRSAMATWWGENSVAYRVFVTESGATATVSMALALAGLSAAVVETGGRTVVAVPSTDVAEAQRIAGAVGVRAGVSSEQRDLADLSGALSEAASEYDDPNASERLWSEFHGQSVSLLARSHSESMRIVETVLGPLAEENNRSSPLRSTLFCLLDNDLRWSDTARKLGLHRQSLIYRMEQVEKVTGRSVRRTRDLAELWLARSTWEQYAAGRR